VKILLTSHRFFPHIGGIEMVSELLAEEFTKAGHEIIVVTPTIALPPDNSAEKLGVDRKELGSPGVRTKASVEEEALRPSGPSAGWGYRVVRRPDIRRLLQIYRWCDVVLQNQIGLQTAWPLIGLRRPWVIAHHTWVDGYKGPRAWLKRQFLRSARNIAASQALANRMPVEATVIPNPFRAEVFRLPLKDERRNDLIFVGRLIRGKGVHVLIQALRELERRGCQRELTVVGNGPELPQLRDAARGLSVQFAGAQRGHELSELLGRHRILVVPSIDPEPFGIVVIEGLACGCLVVSSRNEGLIEAVGRHGVLFETGNPLALAEAILQADATPELMRGVSQHLSRHNPKGVAHQYLKLLKTALR
jgi:glycogen(starch) synthase